MDESRNSWAALGALRRRLWIIVLCAVVAAAGGYIRAHHKSATYTATAELLFNADTSLEQLVGLPDTSSNADPTTSQADDVAVASLPVITTLTDKALGKAAPNGVNVSVADASASDVVDVTATAASAPLAATEANTYSQQVIGYRRAQERANITTAISGVQSQLAREQGGSFTADQRGSLLTTLSQLESLQNIQPVDIEQLQSAAAPLSANGSHAARDGALGAVIGLIIGLIAALILERLDPRLHALTEIEGRSGLHVWRRRGSGRTDNDRLWHALTRRAGRVAQHADVWQVLVTSLPGAGEARCRLATGWDLACSAAVLNPGAAVAFVAVDADPSWLVQSADEEPSAASLSSEERDESDIRVGISRRSLSISAGGARGSRTVDVIYARPGSASGGRDGRETLARRLAYDYDFLIIDAPTLAYSASKGFSIDAVDAVTATTRLHHSRRDAVEELIDELLVERPGGITLVACRNAGVRVAAPIAARIPVRA